MLFQYTYPENHSLGHLNDYLIHFVNSIQDTHENSNFNLENFFHADFVSGHLELNHLTNATIVYGPTAKPNFDCLIAEDGTTIELGAIKVKVIHTPGHTMESSSFLLLDSQNSPKIVFTGDCLFLGEVGRPDLATGGNLTERNLAKFLFESLQKLKTLPDEVVVFPAHGAGSACGKNISSGTSCTIGKQKKTNYALNDNLSEEEFIEIVTSNLNKPPQYFFYDVMLNKQGYEVLEKILERTYKPITPENFFKMIKDESGYIVIDTRDVDESLKNFVRGSYLISLKMTYAIWTATLFKPEDKLILIADKGKEKEAIVRLARVGYENVVGYVEGGFESIISYTSQIEGLNENLVSVDTIDYSNVKNIINENELQPQSDRFVFVDVREKGEWEMTGVVKDAILQPLGSLEKNIENFLKIGNPLGIYCKSGARAGVAASILKKYGINKIFHVGGILNMQEKQVELVKFN